MMFVLISYLDMKDDREKLIIATLDKIRHFLQRDGGDVSFVSFEDGKHHQRKDTKEANPCLALYQEVALQCL